MVDMSPKDIRHIYFAQLKNNAKHRFLKSIFVFILGFLAIILSDAATSDPLEKVKKSE